MSIHEILENQSSYLPAFAHSFQPHTFARKHSTYTNMSILYQTRIRRSKVEVLKLALK